MVKLSGFFSRLGSCRVLVAGDLLLDTYTIGKARCISPEAPVAIVHVQREEHRPGGAGNVMVNLISMGCQVKALGRLGSDLAGQRVNKALIQEGIDLTGIVIESDYSTPVKNRIIAENQQIVRVDHEQNNAISKHSEQSILNLMPALMEDVDVIAISDYGKGFLSRQILADLIACGKKKNIPIIADPKGVDFTRYRGATILKPNLSEAFAAAGLPYDAPLEHVARRVLALSESEVLMITRSEAGISLFFKEGQRRDFPVQVQEVKDVTGAGDTVLSMLACALGNQLPLEEAVHLSNRAAGLAIQHLGCARITLSEVAHHLLKENVSNKVYDKQHLFALEQVLKGRKYALLKVSEAGGLTSTLFEAIQVLAQRPDWDLLVYVNDSNRNQKFAKLLASLNEVNFIIVDEETLDCLCQHQAPQECYEMDEQILSLLT